MDHHQNENENLKRTVSEENTTTVVSNNASHLTRSELLKRRLNNLKRLSKHYRWALMDHLRTLYAHYLCDSKDPISLCASLNCVSKAMPLTTFCHQHILSDPNQKLYNPCRYVIKSAAGQGGCGKPILRSIVSSLCTVHFEKAEKHLSRTLKSHICSPHTREKKKGRELKAGKQDKSIAN